MKKNKQCSLCLESISLIDGCLGQTVIYIDSSMNGDTIYQKKGLVSKQCFYFC